MKKSPPVKILPATRRHFPAWWELRCKLWPKEARAGLRRDMATILRHPKEASLVAEVEGQVVGFVDVRLRDYAEGAVTSPVGYIEGWYVLPKFRKQGIGRALVKAGETWARKRGATEIGSDTNTWNRRSQKAHRRLGYKEVERLVVFYRRLK